jgi:hypothetical protein
MERANAAKMTRFLLNSHRFLWGITGENQVQTYDRLRRVYGLEFVKGSYTIVTRQLLDQYGMARILEEVLAEVRRRFTTRFIESAREHWIRGEWPSLDTIDRLGVRDPVPFLETDARRTFVKRWGGVRRDILRGDRWDVGSRSNDDLHLSDEGAGLIASALGHLCPGYLSLGHVYPFP